MYARVGRIQGAVDVVWSVRSRLLKPLASLVAGGDQCGVLSCGILDSRGIRRVASTPHVPAIGHLREIIWIEHHDAPTARRAKIVERLTVFRERRICELGA